MPIVQSLGVGQPYRRDHIRLVACDDDRVGEAVGLLPVPDRRLACLLVCVVTAAQDRKVSHLSVTGFA